MENGQKKETRRSLISITLLLRSHTVDVSREHRTFLHIRYTQEASSDALEADGEAAVRRHAVLERIEIEMERIGVHATTEHLLAVVGCSVRPSASALCSPLCLSPVRALSLPRATGAHSLHPAWLFRAR